MMNDHGYCKACGCHWTDHELSQTYVVKCMKTETLDNEAMKVTRNSRNGINSILMAVNPSVVGSSVRYSLYLAKSVIPH